VPFGFNNLWRQVLWGTTQGPRSVGNELCKAKIRYFDMPGMIQKLN
jgi:hypothetical protein